MSWHLFPTKRPKVSLTTVDLLVLFGLMVLFYGNPLLHPALMSYSGDALRLFLPGLDLYRNSMYHGVIPLWNPYMRMGTPFLASFQSAVLYPPQLVSLLFSDPIRALNFGSFLSILWFSFGAYLFGLRALKLARFPSLMMGVALGASGFVGAHIDHVNQLAAISWIPWILTETLLLLRKPKIKHVVGLTLCVGMQVLAGHPQYVVYTLVYLAALDAIYFVYFLHRRRIDDPPAWLGMVLLVVAIVAGIGLASAQILPSAELAGRSIRQLDDTLWSNRMYDFSYPPSHLLTLFAPNAYGNPATGLHNLNGLPLEGEEMFNFCEYTAYLGLVPLALALLAVVTLFREFVVRCFLFLGLISLLLAFGNRVPMFNTPPYSLISIFLPTVEHMRAPARFMVFFDISVVVLAAVGFNQFIFFMRVRQRGSATAIAPLCFLILVVALFDLYWFSLSQTFRYRDRTDVMAEDIHALDILRGTDPECRVFRLMFEVGSEVEDNRLRWQKAQKRDATRLQIQRLEPNLNMLSDTAICQGYEEGLQPTLANFSFIYQQCRRNLFTPQPDTRLLGLMNVKYLMTDKPVFSERLRLIQARRYLTILPGDPLVFDMGKPVRTWSADVSQSLRHHAIYENLDFLPRFVWGRELRQAYRLETLDADGRRAPKNPETGEPLPFLGYRVDPDRTPDIPPASRDERALKYYRPNASPNAYRIVKSERVKGDLVQLESAYPGWVCRWDGAREPMTPLNAIMMSCVVPVGPAEVEVAYEPFSFRLGLFISCCFVMVLTTLCFFFEFPRDKEDPLKRRLRRRRRMKSNV